MNLIRAQVKEQLIEVEAPATPLQILSVTKTTASNGDVVVGAIVDGAVVDLGYPLEPRFEPYVVQFVDTSTDEGLEILRHSTSHVMTQAVKRLFGDRVQLGVGPATKDGFYQDYFLPELSESDLPKIEEEMRKIVAEANDFVRAEVSKDAALELFSGDELKRELICDIPSESVTVYQQREYHDLCRGPHVPNSSVLRAFKLLRVSGAYWRGDSNRQQLKRIYGIAYPTQALLDQELTRREEAARRDHRRVGAELGLFVFSDLAPGAPVFLPNGTAMYNELIEFKRELMRRWEYVEVRTPTILNRKLWEISGHWNHYRENMFTLSIDDDDYAVKPMNCPGSTIVYQSRPRSYRELPLRLGEFGYVHRHELSGVLTGLLRVRAFTQDDAHLYVRPDQIEEEVTRTIQMFQELYRVFGFTTRIALSTRPKSRMGEEALWDTAESSLVAALEAMNIEYELKPGDGAFYGPKIDFHIQDCLGREWQCGTCQLDFQLPEKFDLSFVAENGSLQRPVIIHPAGMGSIERFMAICIEEFDGHFPTWLAPLQVAILPVSEKAFAYAEHVANLLGQAKLRAEVDKSPETLNKKIRNAHGKRVSYMLVVGPKEAAVESVSVRDRQEKEQRDVPLARFISMLSKDIGSRQRVPFTAQQFADESGE